jgi:hypothetical protein
VIEAHITRCFKVERIIKQLEVAIPNLSNSDYAIRALYLDLLHNARVAKCRLTKTSQMLYKRNFKFN